MSDDGSKAWKKTEDIPKRFDELPPEPEWIPVADVIRTQREDEAKKEAQKIKILPPLDSDSDHENDTQHKEEMKKEKPPMHYKDKNMKKLQTPKKSDDDVPPTVDEVTQSMINWALSTDHHPKKVLRQSPHTEHGKPLVAQQKPSHLVVDKGYNVMERHISKQPSRPPMADNRKHTAPIDHYRNRPDVLSPQMMEKYSAGAAATRAQQSASSHKERHPLLDEPSPDYDDYDPYYSQYQERYYYDQDVEDDGYYYQEQAYEDEIVADPYFYDAGPYYGDYPPYNSEYVYNGPPEYYEHEQSMPRHPYDHPGAPPHYNQTPHAIPRDKPHSEHDVLY